jgi:hypothetical protein
MNSGDGLRNSPENANNRNGLMGIFTARAERPTTGTPVFYYSERWAC